MFLVSQIAAVDHPIEYRIVSNVNSALRNCSTEIVLDTHHALELSIAHRELGKRAGQLGDDERVWARNTHVGEDRVRLEGVGNRRQGERLEQVLIVVEAGGGFCR